jgi:hypothetical protein
MRKLFSAKGSPLPEKERSKNSGKQRIKDP